MSVEVMRTRILLRNEDVSRDPFVTACAHMSRAAAAVDKAVGDMHGASVEVASAWQRVAESFARAEERRELTRARMQREWTRGVR